MKTLLKKNKVRAFLKALFRGLVRSLPFGVGNVLIETGDALSGNKMPDRKLLNDPELTTQEAVSIDKFRRWIQITIQLIITACVIYSFLTGKIDLNQLLDFINTQNVTPGN